MRYERFSEFFTEAEVDGDAIGIEVIVVDAGGHDGDAPERFGESVRDTARDRLLLVRRYGQHRTGGRPLPALCLCRLGLREHDATHVWPLTATDRDHQVLADGCDPSFDSPTTPLILDPHLQRLHSHLRVKV